MRRWEHHRTRSKVALLLLINLVTLLGGRYTALITIVKLELFGEAIALAKTPKKKPAKSQLGGDQPNPTLAQSATRRSTKLGQRWREPRLPSHVVRRGETLAQIAHRYGVSIEALQAANRLENADHLLTGQKLRIPPQDVAAGAGSEANARTDDRALFLGVQRHLERYAHPPTKARHRFLWPVEGTLTSPFGERDHVMGGGGAQFHAGIDLAVPIGTPVRAAQEGIVVFAGYNGAYGKVVKLDHLNGYSTLYAHNSRLLVHVGQTVKAGQVICLSGNTGRSTGPHLHFEVHKDGWPVDPLPHLQ
jgi:murein DD-endopeptidase MepM/ murein hydrolase activator NlpD